MAGLRGDAYDFDAMAKTPGSSEGGIATAASRRSSASRMRSRDNVELYGNWGEGFHSNDARGVVNADDPVPGLSPGEGYESSARGSRSAR